MLTDALLLLAAIVALALTASRLSVYEGASQPGVIAQGKPFAQFYFTERALLEAIGSVSGSKEGSPATDRIDIYVGYPSSDGFLAPRPYFYSDLDIAFDVDRSLSDLIRKLDTSLSGANADRSRVIIHVISPSTVYRRLSSPYRYELNRQPRQIQFPNEYKSVLADLSNKWKTLELEADEYGGLFLGTASDIRVATSSRILVPIDFLTHSEGLSAYFDFIGLREQFQAALETFFNTDKDVTRFKSRSQEAQTAEDRSVADSALYQYRNRVARRAFLETNDAFLRSRLIPKAMDPAKEP